MSKTHKIGMIGLDTSHVEAFAKLLNDPNDPNHIPGGQVVAAYPGGSSDFEMSISRVEGFTNTLRDEYDVKILESPEAVAEYCDLVFIETIDGRKHKDMFQRIAKYGKPTFIDKPFTANLQDAKDILELAHNSAIPVMSCSSLRYADNLQAALTGNGAGNEESGSIVGCDTFGPMEIMPPLPGFYWYGIHTVEMLVTVMGAGCKQVQVAKNRNNDLLVCEWEDGRVGTIRGLRNAHSQFGITLHREKNFQPIDIYANTRPYYASLLEAILRSLPEGRSDIPDNQMLEVIRIIEAANESRETNKHVSI